MRKKLLLKADTRSVFSSPSNIQFIMLVIDPVSFEVLWIEVSDCYFAHQEDVYFQQSLVNTKFV